MVLEGRLRNIKLINDCEAGENKYSHLPHNTMHKSAINHGKENYFDSNMI